MQAQMGGSSGNNSRPSISKEKAKEIFFDSEEKKFESMKKMMSDPRNQQMDTQDDQMKAMIEMMVQQAKLSDEMFEKHGIEEEEFN
jgi:hypothetical protein